jgi:hypothetical protein
MKPFQNTLNQAAHPSLTSAVGLILARFLNFLVYTVAVDVTLGLLGQEKEPAQATPHQVSTVYLFMHVHAWRVFVGIMEFCELCILVLMRLRPHNILTQVMLNHVEYYLYCQSHKNAKVHRTLRLDTGISLSATPEPYL